MRLSRDRPPAIHARSDSYDRIRACRTETPRVTRVCRRHMVLRVSGSLLRHVSRSAHAGFVLVVPKARFQRDALEQALRDRKPVSGDLVHHSDLGVQYVSIKYTRRLVEAGLAPSVGSVGRQLRQRPRRVDQRALHGRGDSSARTVAITRGGEYATLEWVDSFNNRRLLEPIGHVPPAEAEAAYYAALDEPAARAAWLPQTATLTSPECLQRYASGPLGPQPVPSSCQSKPTSSDRRSAAVEFCTASKLR
jgi:hypothetical protein